MPLFDFYIMVDWSGAGRRRGRRSDTIWIAHGSMTGDAPITESPFRLAPISRKSKDLIDWIASVLEQPRGGPMLSEHKSHQVGLDVDIWFTPMPDHVQTREEREFALAVDVVEKDQLDVDPQVWTRTHTNLIRTAAHDPTVTRILVNAAIKKALCREAGANRAWLSKARPWYGHAGHFHVQIACPAASAECKRLSDGCGHELDFWFKESTLHPPPPKPKPPLTLAGLPSKCKQIVRAP